jgi:hypothetical protein
VRGGLAGGYGLSGGGAVGGGGGGGGGGVSRSLAQDWSAAVADAPAPTTAQKKRQVSASFQSLLLLLSFPLFLSSFSSCGLMLAANGRLQSWDRALERSKYKLRGRK